MLAEEHGGEGDGSVVVVRGGDDDGVEVLLGIEELAPVAVGAGSGVFFGWAGETGFVDVAEGDDLDLGEFADFAEIAAALAGDSDVSGGELFGGRGLAAAGDEVSREDERGGAGGDDGVEEAAAGEHGGEDGGSGAESPDRRSGEGNPDCGREEWGEDAGEARESDACLVAAAVFKTVRGE